MKVLNTLNILLFFILFTFIVAKNPHRNGYHHPSHKNSTKYPNYENEHYFSPRKNGNNYDYASGYNYNHNRKRFFEYEVCPTTIILASTFLSLWIALFILYFLVNKKKKSFTVMINKNENNAYGYMNV